MFKKESQLEERSKSKIQSKDIKKLKSDAEKHLLLSEEELSEYINKKVSVTQTKLASRTHIYSVNDIPILVDKESRNDYYPTVYFLWKFPHALRCLIIHSQVSDFVLNGADLMLPGLATTENLEGLKKGDKVSIRVLGNPFPFAVGDSLVSYETIITYGLKGKAVSTIHIFNDCLYHSVSNARTLLPHKDSFTTTRILPIPGYIDPYVEMKGSTSMETNSLEPLEQDSHIEESVVTNSDENNIENSFKNVIEDSLEENTEMISLPSSSTTTNQQDDNDDDIKITLVDSTSTTTNISDIMTNEKLIETIPPVLPVTDMNILLQLALLRCLKYIVKDIQLPMPISSLWTKILKCTIENELSLDLKKSKYRKVSDFLFPYIQSELLYISDENDVQSIHKISRQHEIWKTVKLNIQDANVFRSHVKGEIEGVYWNPGSKPTQEESSENIPEIKTSYNVLDSLATSTSDQIISKVSTLNTMKIQIEKGKYKLLDVYKVPKNFLSDVLSSKEGELGIYLQVHEVKSILVDYIRHYELEKSPLLEEKGYILLSSLNSDISSLYQYCKKHVPYQPITTTTTTTSSSNSLLGESTHHDDEEEEDRIAMNSDEELEELNKKYSGNTDVSSSFIVNNVLVSSIDHMKLNLKTTSSQLLPPPPPSPQDSRNITRNESSSSTSEVKPYGFAKGISLPPNHPSTSSKKKSQINKTSIKETHTTQKEENDINKEMQIKVKKEDVFKMILTKLTPYHAIIDPSGEVTVKAGKANKIEINSEIRSGNKMVTIILGLEHYNMDMNNFIKACKKKFACSVSLSDVAGKKDKEVVIQGPFHVQVEQMLIEDYGLPRTSVESTVKANIGKPKKSK